MTKNNKYEILTKDGFKDFDGLLESRHSEYVSITFSDGTDFTCSKDHKLYKDDDYINVLELKELDIVSNKIISKISIIKGKEEIFYDPVNVKDNSSYISSGLDSHNCDETSFIKANLFEEFMDSVMPAMAAIQDSQAIFSSTANGLNHFYWMVEGARKQENGYNLCIADWQEVPRWNKDGSIKSPEQFKLEQVAKSGDQHFQQNFGNEFLGSSATLISGTTLKNITPVNDDNIIFNTLFHGLRIFNEVEVGHHYIITVDPKIDGADLVGVQVVDVTSLPFKQVASANLEETYLLIPSRIYDLAEYYNRGMIIVENNIDMTIADALFYQYEYEGEVFREKKAGSKTYKSKLGFRTTTKTKKITTSMLKKFIEDGMLEIQDKKTLDELFNFIEKNNGTFSAEEGYHDDLVMSMTLLFAPFLNIKDWDDFKGFINLIEDKQKEDEEDENETLDFLDLGFAPDSELTELPFTEAVWEDDPFAPTQRDISSFEVHNPDDGNSF